MQQADTECEEPKTLELALQHLPGIDLEPPIQQGRVDLTEVDGVAEIPFQEIGEARVLAVDPARDPLAGHAHRTGHAVVGSAARVGPYPTA